MGIQFENTVLVTAER